MSFKRRPHSDSDTDTDAAGPAPHAFNQIGVHAPRAQLLEIGPDSPKTEDTGTALAGPLPRHVTGESSRLGDATRSCRQCNHDTDSEGRADRSQGTGSVRRVEVRGNKLGNPIIRQAAARRVRSGSRRVG